MDQFFSREQLFSAEMVSSPKPSPDLFLYACDKMGFEKQNAIIIEDSATGIKASQAAKIPVIAFTGGSHYHSGNLLFKLNEFSDLRVCNTTNDLIDTIHEFFNYRASY